LAIQFKAFSEFDIKQIFKHKRQKSKQQSISAHRTTLWSNKECKWI